MADHVHRPDGRRGAEAPATAVHADARWELLRFLADARDVHAKLVALHPDPHGHFPTHTPLFAVAYPWRSAPEDLLLAARECQRLGEVDGEALATDELTAVLGPALRITDVGYDRVRVHDLTEPRGAGAPATAPTATCRATWGNCFLAPEHLCGEAPGHDAPCVCRCGHPRPTAAVTRASSHPPEPSMREPVGDHVAESLPTPPADAPPLDFSAFSAANRARCEAPTGFNHPLASWSLSDWMTAAIGELGEAANVVKKLNRVRDGIRGNKEGEVQLRAKLASELADTFIYLDLMAQRAGIDLAAAVRATFAAKSREIGYVAVAESPSSRATLISDDATTLADCLRVGGPVPRDLLVRIAEGLPLLLADRDAIDRLESSCGFRGRYYPLEAPPSWALDVGDYFAQGRDLREAMTDLAAKQQAHAEDPDA